MPCRARDDQALMPRLRVADRDVDVALVASVGADRDACAVGRCRRLRQVVLNPVGFADRELLDESILAPHIDLPSLAAASIGCAVELATLRPGQTVHRGARDRECGAQPAPTDRDLAN